MMHGLATPKCNKTVNVRLTKHGGVFMQPLL